MVGCRVGRAWVAGARAGDDTVAWAVADLNQELARRVAQENDVARVYGDYRELLADDEVDAVGDRHLAPDVRKPMVIDALKAGKHVLVQKPHGRNAADVERDQYGRRKQLERRSPTPTSCATRRRTKRAADSSPKARSGAPIMRASNTITASVASIMSRDPARIGCTGGA